MKRKEAHMRPQKWIVVLISLFISHPMYAAMEVHEWGTFTSLVGSNGLTQHGMYHEDEALPTFVHPFGFTQLAPFPIVDPGFDNDNCMNMKICFSRNTLQNNVITQKMETPVIYFYGKPAGTNNRVKVNVKFPEGIITDTFPGPIAASPQNNSTFVAIKNGEATFDVEVLDATTSSLIPFVDSKNIYSHARGTKSQVVRTNSENEKFIFYRGIGRFQPRISISSHQGNLELRSSAASQPLAGFVISVSPDGKHQQMYRVRTSDMSTTSGFQLNSQIVQNLTTTFPYVMKSIVTDSAVIRKEMIAALQNAGLFEDEATAMINTWEQGYLRVPGLRLLYVLPRAEVDAILPLTLTPAADKLQRAFIARIEIMTDIEEQKIIDDIQMVGQNFDLNTLGRFAEPKLRRVQQVYASKSSSPKAYDPAVANTINDLVNKSITFAESASTVTH